MKRMTDIQFEKYRILIHHNFGIHFLPTKREIVATKVDKLMRKYNLSSYDEYYQLLTKGANGEYWAEFADEITVHQTNFFREKNHFEFLRTRLRFILESNPRIMETKEIRVWSAGCSTGEEPYTLAMVLKEWLPDEVKIRILATDVSGRSVATAQRGVYPGTIKKDMDPYFLMEYFIHDGEHYQVKPELKELITFRLFNLMDPFPFKNTFDIIFCRNVMIYFDAQVQQELVRKFHNFLGKGGLLFIGHSESLINKQYTFKYIQPTVYQKEK
jgi:chemotaxis protein methyltransferase CheR